MPMRYPPVVVVTGCSSGIGRALALEFSRHGHRVYATARRSEDLAELDRFWKDQLSLYGKIVEASGVKLETR